MIQTRKVLYYPTGKELKQLKKKGAGDAVVTALSTYALPENRQINLLLTLDLETSYGAARAPYFYLALISIEKGKARQEDFIFGPLSQVLGFKWKGDRLIDGSDPLLPRKIRRIQIPAPVRATRYGDVEFRLLVSRQPDIRDLVKVEDLRPEDQERVERIPFDYPAVSRSNQCQLDLRLTRDAMLPDSFTIKRQNLRCFWD